MKNILLIEPDYKNKYPPLGLMKIAAYHRIKGDKITFVKGCNATIRDKQWDRVYISTLFTFFWNKTISTIKYYQRSAAEGNIYVGGVMATLMKKEIQEEVSANIIEGLLDRPNIIGKDKIIIDTLIPDYSILQQIDYAYPTGDAYIGYATRGCVNRCKFCAVHKIEPCFTPYLPLKKQIEGIERLYGPKKDLLLLDNNVLASDKFEQIIEDIIDLGFGRGAKFGQKLRYVDFNQGLDARLLTKERMALLSKIAIRPMRIAFDHISMMSKYISRVEMAAKHDILNLSNFILYNYYDSPVDLYKRLKVNIDLNQRLGTKIYSFPMKYIPLGARDRTHIGPKWNKKYIRTIQSILLATHGMVSPNKDFFEAAFGRNETEFRELLLMPERYIINRMKHMGNGAADWRKKVSKLTRNEKEMLKRAISENKVTEEQISKVKSRKVKKVLDHYLD